MFVQPGNQMFVMHNCSRSNTLPTHCTGAGSATSVQQVLRRAARRQKGQAGTYAGTAEEGKPPARGRPAAAPVPPQQPVNSPARKQQQPAPRQPKRQNGQRGPRSLWDLQLASIPGLRKRFVRAPNNPQLPFMSNLVVVEGWTDAQAVQRAANAAVYVCDGDTVKSSHAQRRLQALVHWAGEIVILTDPDAGGRMLRIFLDDAFRLIKQKQQQHQHQQQHEQQPQTQATQQAGSLPGVLHAFVPINDAISSEANSRHDVGSVGVENAAPKAILTSLKAAAPSYYPRQEFSQVELMEAGFINAFNTKQVLGAKLRREVLCSALGIDSCTGSALITALNRFFTREQYEQAVRIAEAAVARQIMERQEK
ncbi:hypothetical protein DUNSADRAFT_6938 [Dunaliella salina]|uniref:Uncharacterized protein n=1 Tax=Dunaliella salina TaxID=3046 RepID=A0ABQ7GMB7_DUNSA|nr:hypothetical protein DUNSADRAFT_6938 [Dunaliella salina]|eukprot:KAF5835757.1 hypothetical protein DUNSADRAFT_6938 [Dunaliella salina]